MRKVTMESILQWHCRKYNFPDLLSCKAVFVIPDVERWLPTVGPKEVWQYHQNKNPFRWDLEARYHVIQHVSSFVHHSKEKHWGRDLKTSQSYLVLSLSKELLRLPGYSGIHFIRTQWVRKCRVSKCVERKFHIHSLQVSCEGCPFYSEWNKAKTLIRNDSQIEFFFLLFSKPNLIQNDLHCENEMKIIRPDGLEKCFTEVPPQLARNKITIPHWFFGTKGNWKVSGVLLIWAKNAKDKHFESIVNCMLLYSIWVQSESFSSDYIFPAISPWCHLSCFYLLFRLKGC